MSAAADMAACRPALASLAEMTSAVLERVYARIEEAEGDDFYAAVGVFTDLGKSLRLTISLNLRLAALARAAARPAEAVRVRPEAEPLDLGLAAEPRDPVERERERDRESDGFPLDPLGRVEALEGVIARHPDLDPDRTVTAQIIELKAFLGRRDPPPEPAPPDPGGPPASTPTAYPGLSRPPNRAERRRRRRSSG